MGVGNDNLEGGILFILSSQTLVPDPKKESIDDVALISEFASENKFENKVIDNLNNLKAILNDYKLCCNKSYTDYGIPSIVLIDAKLIKQKETEISIGRNIYDPDEKCFYFIFINNIIGKAEENCGFKKGSSVIIYGTHPEVGARQKMQEKPYNFNLVIKPNDITMEELKKTKRVFFEKIIGRRRDLMLQRPENSEYKKYEGEQDKEKEAHPGVSMNYNQLKKVISLSGTFSTSDDVLKLVSLIKKLDEKNEFYKNNGLFAVDISDLIDVNDLAMNFFNQLKGLTPHQTNNLCLLGYEKFKGKITNLIYSAVDKRYNTKAREFNKNSVPMQI